MPISGTQVGSNTQLTVSLGDPSAASQLQGVPSIADNTNVTGKYGSLGLAVPSLKNPVTGNYDTARATPGGTGIQAVSSEGTKNTYSSASVGVTLAATATDFWQIIGSSSKTVRILKIVISGFATAAITKDILLILAANDTGGTATQPTIVPNDSNNVAATAVINLYSANPTLGTAVGTIRARKLNLGATGSAGTIEWNFSNNNDQAIVLRGVAQGLSLNYNGQAVASGTLLNIECEFVEDNS